MRSRIQKLLDDLTDAFWLVPSVIVLASVFAGVGLVELDRGGIIPQRLLDSPWFYNGGVTGARTLLGAVASSTIGVAGTVFTITIAALSLAAGQMGPRLLRNFTRDRGNQITLGIFLGTFSYALMVLRSVRAQSEGEFIPHLSLSVAVGLAFVCVGTLIYFVHHIASRINVETVHGHSAAPCGAGFGNRRAEHTLDDRPRGRAQPRQGIRGHAARAKTRLPIRVRCAKWRRRATRRPLEPIATQHTRKGELEAMLCVHVDVPRASRHQGECKES